MASAPRIVMLKCESASRNFDQRPRAILVTNETERAWIGAPIANPACPELTWPKFAWIEVA